jgi:hypothetical protein
MITRSTKVLKNLFSFWTVELIPQNGYKILGDTRQWPTSHLHKLKEVMFYLNHFSSILPNWLFSLEVWRAVLYNTCLPRRCHVSQLIVVGLQMMQNTDVSLPTSSWGSWHPFFHGSLSLAEHMQGISPAQAGVPISETCFFPGDLVLVQQNSSQQWTQPTL